MSSSDYNEFEILSVLNRSDTTTKLRDNITDVVVQIIDMSSSDYNEEDLQKDILSQNVKSKKMLRFQRNIICAGCRFEYAEKKETCQRKLSYYTKMNATLSVEEAATTIAEQYNNTCYRCNPNNCSVDDKIYYRPDDIVNSFIESSTTHRLQSIHEDHRIPTSIFNSPNELSNYLSEKMNQYPKRQYLYEFNPSIIILPKNQIPNSIPDALYLTAYRVSSLHNCLIGHMDGFNMRGGAWDSNQHRDYLGLALVDKYLQILVETVVDVKNNFYQDGRLFVLKDQIYLGSSFIIHPIWIIPPTSTSVDKINYYQVDNQTGTFEQLTFVLPQYYNKQDSSTTTGSDHNGKFSVFMRKAASCTTSGYFQGGGKNFNYFVDTNDRIILEIYPMDIKEILYINKECKIKSREDPNNDFLPQTVNNVFPPPSFGTTDEIELLNHNIDWFPYTGERGSICCVSINDPGNISHSLLLGLSHSKTRHKNNKKPTDTIQANHYFSSFYAMEPNEPYNVVARSGRFCLGYPSYNQTHPSADDELQEPYPRLYLDPLIIGSETYHRCPRIHFVMGMIEKVDDPNKPIILCGVEDCISRFIVIDKKNIIPLLFYPQKLLANSYT